VWGVRKGVEGGGVFWAGGPEFTRDCHDFFLVFKDLIIGKDMQIACIILPVRIGNRDLLYKLHHKIIASSFAEGIIRASFIKILNGSLLFSRMHKK